MRATALAISDVLLLEPRVFGDDRGFFYESYNQLAFKLATGLDIHFVQDNHSRSARNVLRGMHYQLAPRAQGKLVRFDALLIEAHQSSRCVGGKTVLGEVAREAFDSLFAANTS